MKKHGGAREGAGRKKGFAAIKAEEARRMICEKLETHGVEIIDTAIEQAIAGDAVARNFLYERGYGRVAQAIVTEDEEGNTQPIEGNRIIFVSQDGTGTDSK